MALDLMRSQDLRGLDERRKVVRLWKPLEALEQRACTGQRPFSVMSL